jgi:uncharacterized membrane protein YeaQ/YmgE (transglycosylase-associated protein family)
MTMAVPKRRQADGPYAMTASNTRQLALFLGIGLLAGFLASFVVGGDGLFRYLITGVLGALVGGYLFSALRIELPVKNQFLSQVITATVGAVIVVIIAKLIA